MKKTMCVFWLLGASILVLALALPQHLCAETSADHPGAVIDQGQGAGPLTKGPNPPVSPPDLQLSEDASVLICPGESVCLDIFASDPDYRDSITVEKIYGVGTYPPVTDTTPISDTYCFYPPASGSYKFIFQVTDKGGLSDRDSTTVTVKVNEPPVVTSPDTVIFDLCDTATVCFPIKVSDPDDDLFDLIINVNPPGFISSCQYVPGVCFYAGKDTTYEFIIIVTDGCGQSDTAYTTAIVIINDPPVVTAPDTVKYNLSDTATVCFDISISDPDDILHQVSCTPPGQYNASDTSICFFADKNATHDFTIIVADSCEETDTAYTTALVNFVGNQPPVLTVPADVDTYLCEAETLCFVVEAADADPGDSIILEKIEGPGVFAPDTGVSPLSDSICFLPDDVDSTYRFIFRATDRAGAFDQDTFYVTIDLNQPPAVVVPADSSIFLCEPETLCFDISFSDADNPASASVNSPWYYDSEDTSICLFASSETTYCCTVIVTDSCQAADTGFFCLTLDMNQKPEVKVPADVDTFLCEAETLCFVVEASDPDPGDTLILEMMDGPGTFAPDTGLSPLSDSICFLPADFDSTYQFIFRATNHCGATDEDTFSVTVDINQPPVVVVPPDTSFFLSEPETLCFDLNLSDPEDSVDVSVNSPWYYDSLDTSICLYASEETTYCCTVIVSDPCEEADTGWMCLTVGFNQPPTVEVVSPASGDTLDHLPTLSIHLKDDLGLERAYYQIDGCTGTWTELWSYNSNSLDTTIDWTVPSVSPGTHDIYFKVIDDKGKINVDTCSYFWRFTYLIPKVSLVPDYLACQCKHDYILWIHLDQYILNLDSAFFKIGYEDQYLAATNVLKGPDLNPSVNFTVSRVIYPDSILISLSAITGAFDGPGQVLGLILTPGTQKVITPVSIEYSVLYDSAGQEIIHQTSGAQIEISCQVSVDENDVVQIPSSYGLSQNCPNPYNSQTRIAYQLPEPGEVSLRVYNIKGQLIRTLVEGHKPAGSHVAVWDSRNQEGMKVSSGIYFYRLRAGAFTDTKKMVLLK